MHIATTLSGLFIKSEPWKNAHQLWFERIATLTGDYTFHEWKDKPNYFEGVNLAMQRLYPDFTKEQQTQQARKSYFDAVIEYVRLHPETIRRDVAHYFESLQIQKALITTNTQEAVEMLLDIAHIKVFDIISSSQPHEEDDKITVFQRHIEQHGNPVCYIGAERKDTMDFCNQYNIPFIFARFEQQEPQGNTIDAPSLVHLQEVMQQFTQ